MEELESFLNQREVAELRRRELLHKHWTERVWMPLQRRVEQCVSSCTAEETKRRQSLYSNYLHHCNSKGFVFLDTGDLKEYNPFLYVKNKHYFKASTLPQALSYYLVSTSRQTPLRDETDGRKSSRIQYHSTYVQLPNQTEGAIGAAAGPPNEDVRQLQSNYIPNKFHAQNTSC
ncbi:protein FAM228A [Scomber japonicus]|uniref:protein FAM228A n=1 Tax=Scomber japonicus TaxID=13676 RepID=UPI0023058E69|nr:protein FAM228A [Scomber japonicus]